MLASAIEPLLTRGELYGAGGGAGHASARLVRGLP